MKKLNTQIYANIPPCQAAGLPYITNNKGQQLIETAEKILD